MHFQQHVLFIEGRSLAKICDPVNPVNMGSLMKANPNGIDPNYFYGDFMLEEGKPDEAMRYLEKAMNAPPRPDEDQAVASDNLTLASYDSKCIAVLQRVPPKISDSVISTLTGR